MSCWSNAVKDDDCGPPSLLDNDSNGGLNAEDDDDGSPEGLQDEEKECNGSLPLLGQEEIDKLQPRKQYSLMEVQEFLNSSNHAYRCDLVYTRTFVGGGGAAAAVGIFLRQGKPKRKSLYYF